MRCAQQLRFNKQNMTLSAGEALQMLLYFCDHPHHKHHTGRASLFDRRCFKTSPTGGCRVVSIIKTISYHNYT